MAPVPPALERLRQALRQLYTGSSRRARRFRYGLISFDALSIIYFILSAAAPPSPLTAAVDTTLGLLILADLGSRLWVSPSRRREILRVYSLADMVVVVSLLIGPWLADDVAFLRILRGLRLIHSYHLVRDLRRESRFFRLHEDAIYAAVNLFVFIFVTTSFVFVVAFDERTGIDAYIDALYFTVATLTTTGFGDITLDTPGGKLLSVFIMVVGVALFVQLARAVFQPTKIRHKCPDCGLVRHDPDAIHCKHCGNQLKIETEGSSGA